MSVIGLDVSKWQGEISWPAVAKAGAKFAFCKASQGKSHKDPSFIGNFTQARQPALGMIPAAYHFFNGSIAAKEADNFLSQVYAVWQPGEPGIFALDLEWTQDGEARPPEFFAEAREFLRLVEHDLKRKMPIYTQNTFWAACGNPTGFYDNPLWEAEHTSNLAKPPTIAPGWKSWTFHQYTGSEQVPGEWPGITGNIDLNRFNGDEAALHALAGASIAVTGPDIVEPRPPVSDSELDANFIRDLQRLLNRYTAHYGFDALVEDGIRGPKTNAAIAETPLGRINVRTVESRPFTIDED